MSIGMSNPNTLFKCAVKAGEIFKNDYKLVHGDYSIGSVADPPSAYGIYSIRIVTSCDQPNRLSRAKVLIVGCMDKRIARPQYIEVLQKFNLEPKEILTLYVGGGIIQEDPKREKSLKAQVAYIAKTAPLRTIIASSHAGDSTLSESGGCGGIKYFCDGIPLKDLTDKDLFPDEIAATNAITPRHAFDVLNGNGNDLISGDGRLNELNRNKSSTDNKYMLRDIGIRVWNIIPDETLQRIRKIEELKMNSNSPRLKDIRLPK